MADEDPPALIPLADLNAVLGVQLRTELRKMQEADRETARETASTVAAEAKVAADEVLAEVREVTSRLSAPPSNGVTSKIVGAALALLTAAVMAGVGAFWGLGNRMTAVETKVIPLEKAVTEARVERITINSKLDRVLGALDAK
ncbi:MAG: hypothetical protein ABH877_04190 [bacterium]